MTDRDTVTVKRYPSSPTQAADGSIDKTSAAYTTANRTADGLGYSIKCRIMPMPADEKMEYGIAAASRAWKFAYHANPSITKRDIQTFTDQDGVARTAYTVRESTNLDEQARIWIVVGSEDDAQT